MLKNTAFHDNLYQLSRIIEVCSEGLLLDLSEDMFLEKYISDIRFISQSLENFFTEVQKTTHLPDYIQILQCLYSCESDYLIVLRSFTAKIAEKIADLHIPVSELSTHYKTHNDIKDVVETLIQTADAHRDACQMVSQNELTQLLAL